MSLSTEVIARYPTGRLRQLTNQGDQSATTTDTTVLGLAATDVQADFEIVAGIVYDGTEARHVSVAVEGVIAKLRVRSEAAGGGADTSHDRYIERLQGLAKVTGRDRIIPKTSSILTPTSEQLESETVRPSFDHPNFDDVIPRPPS